MWPYYEVAIPGVAALAGGESDLQDYRVLDLTGNLDMAFVLANRWRQFNTGRSLGFTQTGAARLSSSVITLPIMTRQLQGLVVFRKWAAEKPGAEVDLEEFLSESGADEATANELRATLGVASPKALVGDAPAPDGASLLGSMHVDAIVGMDRGSALAIWGLGPGGVARVEFCVGHDCLEFGPHAEEVLLRLVAGRAAGLGARSLLCRVRFTESGRFFVPAAFRGLGLQPVAREAWGESFVEETDDEPADSDADLTAEEAAALAVDVPEGVPGLRLWLTIQGLQEHMEAVNTWCDEVGAATLEEVIDNREELVDALGDLLSDPERSGLLARTY
mmetsp:Transcript_67495/g.217957  ORF Transcript_67495/g.217957 Transcript_67495/m.217957 type:complete len:333 (-) Transcript_67495:102-1100(-)